MQIAASAVSLNVADVPASAAFLASHFGYSFNPFGWLLQYPFIALYRGVWSLAGLPS